MMTSDRDFLESTWLEVSKIRAGLEVMLKKNGYWDAYLRKLDEKGIKLGPGG